MSDNTDQEAIEKFNTCQFRSQDKEKVGHSWCCGDNFHMAYICWERNIEDLSPTDCKNCTKYLQLQPIEKI